VKHRMTDDEYAIWIESPEGKAAIREQFEKHRGSGASRKKGRAYELLEAAGQMNVPVSIRIPASDLAKARDVAERKGLPYQTYIKMLLHEALARAE
jgi:hypothetical protein